MRKLNKSSKIAKPLVCKGSETRQLILETKLRDYVNSLVASFFCRMFEVRGGFLYLLIDHHQYQNFKSAKKVKLGAAGNNKDGFYYVTNSI